VHQANTSDSSAAINDVVNSGPFVDGRAITAAVSGPAAAINTSVVEQSVEQTQTAPPHDPELPDPGDGGGSGSGEPGGGGSDGGGGGSDGGGGGGGSDGGGGPSSVHPPGNGGSGSTSPSGSGRPGSETTAGGRPLPSGGAYTTKEV